MAQAIVDPEQLRQFAIMLKRFNETLGESCSKMGVELNRLGSTWRDQEHRKFSLEFEQQMKQLSRLIESSEKHVPYLLRKAELIEEYHNNG